MKTLLSSMVFSLMLLGIMSCSSQNYLTTSETENLLQGKEFTFMAKKAIPTSNDVVNVLSGMRGNTATRILDLDYGYTVVITKDKLESTLPYFGRTYTPSMDPDKQSYRFTSKDFTISQSNGKKNVQIITIQPRDVSHIRRMSMEVFPNGKAYLTIDANDRQLISYDGYLMKNSAEN